MILQLLNQERQQTFLSQKLEKTILKKDVLHQVRLQLLQAEGSNLCQLSLHACELKSRKKNTKPQNAFQGILYPLWVLFTNTQDFKLLPSLVSNNTLPDFELDPKYFSSVHGILQIQQASICIAHHVFF